MVREGFQSFYLLKFFVNDYVDMPNAHNGSIGLNRATIMHVRDSEKLQKIILLSYGFGHLTIFYSNYLIILFLNYFKKHLLKLIFCISKFKIV